MAEIGGVKLMINTDVQSRKAEELEQLIETMVKKIEEIDEAIKMLVEDGIKGKPEESLLRSYRGNRETISKYIQELAGVANLLYEDAQAKRRREEQADIAAGGGL